MEISKCLIGTQSGLVNFDLGTSQTAGDAARLAVSLRSRSDSLSREMLAGLSTALKVDFRVAESKIIPLFEDFGWVESIRSGSRITSLTETIPPTQDVLGTLGKYWRESEPNVLDRASVESLSMVATRPFSKDALTSEVGIEEAQFEMVLDYGEQAGYLGKFTSSEYSIETIWTPLYWARNADDALKFLKKQSELNMVKVGTLTEAFRKYPGTPDDRLEAKELGLVNAGISHGFFPSVAVTDRKGASHEYIFSAMPQFGIDKNSDVFEKARMIVSCLRHGQYHADITRIHSPQAILSAMRSGTLKPHSYADVQYAILVIYGMVQLERVNAWFGEGFKVNWISNPENDLAADIADQFLLGEEVIGGTREELDAQKILVQGVFNYSSEQRKLKTAQQVVAKKEFDRMLELTSGVRV